MSGKPQLFSQVKTHGITTAVAMGLLLFSSGVWAVNEGPACNLPDDNLTAAQWALNQDNAGGHVDACHVGKLTPWLQQRTVNGQPPNCTRVRIATSWPTAQIMWNQIGQTIRDFCEGAENNANDHIITLQLGGAGNVNIGNGFERNVGAFTVADNERAFIKLRNNGGQ